MFLYIFNEYCVNEFMKRVALIIASKRVQYLKINLIKQVLNLHTEIYKNIGERSKKDLGVMSEKCQSERCPQISSLEIITS